MQNHLTKKGVPYSQNKANKHGPQLFIPGNVEWRKGTPMRRGQQVAYYADTQNKRKSTLKSPRPGKEMEYHTLGAIKKGLKISCPIQQKQ